jgi:hypothetical protein
LFPRKKTFVFDSWIMAEVYEETQSAARGAEIVENLGTMFIG